MGKDPAVLFYTSDFMSGVVGLTMQERGQYISLLCTQHQQGHLSEKTICLLLGIVSVSEIPDVMEKFKVDESGKYYNERMELEAEKRHNFVESRKENAKLGGRPKKDNPKHDDIHTDNHMDNHMGNRNENEYASKDSSFDVFWKTYPRKTAKEDARKAFAALMKKNDAPTIERLIESVEAHKRSDDWKKDDGRFIPHPATYLRQGRYDDEIKSAQKQEVNDADRYAIPEGFKTSF